MGCDGASTEDVAPEGPPLELPPPPANEGLYAYANGCYSMQGFNGKRTVGHASPTQSGDLFAFSEETGDTASHFLMRASDLGTYLFYDTEKRYLTAQEAGAGTWQLKRAENLESSILLLDDSFRSPAEWTIETSTRDPERFQLKHYQTGRYLTLTGLTENESSAAIVTLFPQSDCAEFPELTIDAKGSVAPRTWDNGDVYGFAEIHSHMMTNFGFGGGGIFHGAAFHRLGVEHALPSCEPFHGNEGRNDIVGFFYDGDASLDVAKLLPIAVSGESPEFNHFTDGYPEFTDWPKSWKTSTHQTMYYRWLERAYLGGLRLLVQHATGNSVLCDLVTSVKAQEVRYSCNDMVSVERSITETRALERYIDAQAGGPGKGWFRVVETPKEARDAINEGKLAVVLGIEISNLFDCFSTPKEGFEKCTAESVRAELDRYQDLGVRAIFPVHKYDNAFTAGDGSNGVIELGNLINSGHYSSFVEDCPDIDAAYDGGGVTFGGLNKPRTKFDAPPPLDMSLFKTNVLGTLYPLLEQIQEPALSGSYCQSHGLTALGETLIQELMSRGMIIDISHLPQRSLARTYELLEASDYPATKTHGGTNDGRIYRLGGMTGSGLGRCANADTPGELSRGFKNRIQHATDNGAYPAEGFSFDLNGFAGGPRPRFGDDSGCGEGQANPVEYPFTSYDGNVTFEQPHLGNRDVDFNTEGMIHIGLLPELIEDARRDGATDEDLEPLFRSAEAYIRLWEHAEASAAAL